VQGFIGLWVPILEEFLVGEEGLKDGWKQFFTERTEMRILRMEQLQEVQLEQALVAEMNPHMNSYMNVGMNPQSNVQSNVGTNLGSTSMEVEEKQALNDDEIAGMD